MKLFEKVGKTCGKKPIKSEEMRVHHVARDSNGNPGMPPNNNCCMARILSKQEVSRSTNQIFMLETVIRDSEVILCIFLPKFHHWNCEFNSIEMEGFSFYSL